MFEIPSQLHGITSFHEEVPGRTAFHQYRTEGGKNPDILLDKHLDIVGVGAVGGGKSAVQIRKNVLVCRTGGRVHVVQPQTVGLIADRIVPAAQGVGLAGGQLDAGCNREHIVSGSRTGCLHRAVLFHRVLHAVPVVVGFGGLVAGNLSVDEVVRVDLLLVKCAVKVEDKPGQECERQNAADQGQRVFRFSSHKFLLFVMVDVDL